MDREEIQQKIDLTPAQQKAFRRLQAAVKECEKQHVYFYQVLERLSALNGHNVSEVVGYEETGEPAHGDLFLSHYGYPSVVTVCSFADDPHHVILRDR